MKKLLSAILCLLLIISAVSCANTSNTNDPDSQGSDPYKNIIEKYRELLICQKNNTTVPEANEADSSALKAVYELAKKGKNAPDMGYAKKDINNDGNEELIFTENSLDIVAIFTVKDNEVVLLITQEDPNTMIWIDENGLIRVDQLVVEGLYMTGRRFFVYEISEGALKPQVAIGCDAMQQGDWHRLDNQQQIPVSIEEWNELYAKYDICPSEWDVREYTKNHVNLTVNPLLEAIAPKAQTYKLSSVIKNDHIKINSVSAEGVSFTMFYSKHEDSVLVYDAEISASATPTNGKYLFDNGTVKGSIEFGYNSVWVNIDSSTNEYITCRSYLFDYVIS